MPVVRVLSSGAFHAHERFDASTVNRGAVLWECEWDGGIFESGVMLGGVFRSGAFRSGAVWAAWWKGGVWEDGFWHHGFGPNGSYRPRGACPASESKVVEAVENPIDPKGPLATVFAASVFGDIPRIWLACLRHSVPPDAAAIELFDDAGGALDGALLPGVTLLGRSPERPDFQVAYGDALRRATTPLLAFVDTDVFWLSKDVWPGILREFEDSGVAAVSCVSRAATASPGTFAVVMRTETYRDVVRRVPGAFAPFALEELSGGLPGRCRGDDTGDRIARAVVEAGFEIRHLDLAAPGAFVRFDAITITRLLGEWVGEETLLEMATTNRYFRRGCLGALALAHVHDALFPDGPRFGAPIRAARLWRRLLRHPRTLLRALAEFVEFRTKAALIRVSLRAPQDVSDLVGSTPP